MKKLNTLSSKEILHYIMGSKRLREKFEKHIMESEMNWVKQKTALFWKYGRCADWSIGAYNQNYLHVLNASAFLYAVENSIERFGSSEKLAKMAKQCAKLRDTNLFEYQVDKLCDLYLEEELLSITNHMEDCSYDIYCKNETERLLDYVDCFADYAVDDVYVNSRNELVRLDYLTA